MNATGQNKDRIQRPVEYAKEDKGGNETSCQAASAEAENAFIDKEPRLPFLALQTLRKLTIVGRRHGLGYGCEGTDLKREQEA